MNSQIIDIENEMVLESVSKFLDKYNEGPHIGKVINFFPFDRLRDINSEEKISKVIIILSKFLSSNKFLTSQKSMEHCFEFVLENWKRFVGQLKPILCNLFDFCIHLLIKLRENNEILRLNVNPERICHQIHETFKEATLRKYCLNILIEIFSCFPLESKEIYDNCIKEAYQHRVGVEFLELCRLGSLLLRNIINFKEWSSFKQFRLWILKPCSYNVPFLQILYDRLIINEFIKCLLGIYNIKDSNDYEITQVYVKYINILKSFLSIETFKDNVIDIIKKMFQDLFLMDVLPRIDDNFFEDLKDFSLVSMYLLDAFTKKSIDRREIVNLSKEITIRCYSSDKFHPITLKAICYLFPKYIKNSISNGNVILNALCGCDVEKILTINLTQLTWILNSDRPPLIYLTICFWLKKSVETTDFIRILQETENVKFLIQVIMTDFENEIVSNRAAFLLRLMNDYEVSNSIVSYIPSAIKNPKSLALLLKSKPCIPENLKLATFFCKVMGTILPYIYNTEAFIEVCKYSMHLMVHMKNNKEAVEHFIKFETISVLIKASLSKNNEISISGSETLALLTKLEDLLGLKAEFSIEMDFRRVLKGSITRKKRGLTLLENLLKNPIENNKILKLPETDVLAQFLYVQEISVEDDGIYCVVLTLFLKKYNYLALSCVTPNFVQMVCLNMNSQNKSINKFRYFLDTLIEMLRKEKKILFDRYLNVSSVKKFIAKY
ncbi:uncharacterized protein [Onthophagus taurus]|uniref:uncharacterized protein n=1 Tax=Onthophagus taurus TaxID=166361 RepID=UPI0039BDBD8D